MGAPVPRRGSFEDELRYALDERAKNLRLEEVLLFVKLLAFAFRIPPEAKPMIDDWIERYAAELYGDLYTPDYALEQQRREVEKRRKDRAERDRQAAALAKVARFGDGR